MLDCSSVTFRFYVVSLLTCRDRGFVSHEPVMWVTGSSNVFYSYVKCYLLPDKSKLGKRKTAVKKKTSHPTFNEILRVRIAPSPSAG